jgi:carbon monoxide dehydrogenase subunit G
MIIAEKKFIISSSQQRIWELLLKAVLRFMPFEKMRPLTEKSVRALLKVKMGFISMPMDVEVEVTQTSPPESMITMLRSKAMGGIVWINQKATFTLTPISEDKTEVACQIADDGMGIIVRLFLLWRVKTVSQEAFDGLEERLRQWA